RGVPPAEERLAGLMLTRDEVLGGGEGLLVDGLHPLAGQRAGVLDRLSALTVGLAPEHAARTELLQKRLAVGQLHVLGIVEVLRLLRGIEVVEAAEIFIEAVQGRQMLVAIPLVVLAELPGRITEALEDRGHGGIGLLP